jgi:hypothetical protein
LAAGCSQLLLLHAPAACRNVCPMRSVVADLVIMLTRLLCPEVCNQPCMRTQSRYSHVLTGPAACCQGTASGSLLQHQSLCQGLWLSCPCN